MSGSNASTKQLNVRISSEIYSIAKELQEKAGSLRRVVETGIKLASIIPVVKPKRDPETILDYLILSKLQEILNKEEERRSGLIYVTDIAYCPERYRILRNTPSAALANMIQGSLLTGSLAHLGLLALLKVSLDDIEVEKEVAMDLKDGHTLVGRADIIYKSDVYDVKFVSAVVEDRPHPQYAIQVWTYKILLNAKRAFILYITKKGEILQVPVTDRVISNIIMNLNAFPMSPAATEKLDSEEFIHTWYEWWKEQNGPIWGSWECNYCPVSLFCINKNKKE